MVPSKGLGRGLESLLGKGMARESRWSGNSIPIMSIQPGPSQPRRHIRPEQLRELAESIKTKGVIQPIVVRAIPGAAVPYEIVAGERRWQAARMAGLSEIPVVIRDLTDRDAVAVALIENIQREDLTPAEEARSLARLAREFELTHQEVAEAVGRSRAAVTNLLRLLDLPGEVLELIENRSLGMGHARALLGLESDRDQVRLARQVVLQGLSTRATEALVRKMLRPAAPPSAGPAETTLGVREVMRSPWAHVKLHPGSNGAGRLTIDFRDAATGEAVIAVIQRVLETEPGIGDSLARPRG